MTLDQKMRIKLRLESISNPLEYDADGAYEKGSFYCIRVGADVIKTPINKIFQIVETYGYHAPKGNPELERDPK